MQRLCLLALVLLLAACGGEDAASPPTTTVLGAEATSSEEKATTSEPEESGPVVVIETAAGDEVVHRIGQGRGAYAYLIDGQARFDGQPAATGDAAKVTGQASLTVRAEAPSELILVDVPMEFERVGVWAR